MPGIFHLRLLSAPLLGLCLLAGALPAQGDPGATNGTATAQDDPRITTAKDTGSSKAARLEAIRGLADSAPPGCRAVLQSLVADPDVDIAVAALAGFGDLDPARALAECRRLLTNDLTPPRLRQQAIGWLADGAHPDAKALVVALLDQAAAGGLDPAARADLLQSARAMNDPSLAAAIARATGTGQPVPAPEPAEHPGKRVYANVCASCHADSGVGVAGVYPPLQGTAWLDLDPSVLIRMQLHGLQGSITVNGVTYQSTMPPNAQILDDQEVADVLNYARGQWGKPGLPPVDAAMVARERALHQDREQPWTIAELGGPPAAATGQPAAATLPPAVPLASAFTATPHVPRWGAHVLFLLPMLGFLAACLCLRDH